MGSLLPQTDAELIAYAVTTLRALRLPNVKVKINSLGAKESKLAYRERLLRYLEPVIGGLCPDCQQRFRDNPLRVLDCKADRENRILVDAPKPLDDLSEADRKHFESVLGYLDAMHVEYAVDRTLVRGLDYYTHTAFEFVTTHIGAQGTVLGGGRYDGLIAELGGPPTAGIGWAGGIERLVMLADEPKPLPRPVVIAPLGAAAEAKALGIARALRRQGIAVEQEYRGNMKRRMQRANKLNARSAIILGDDELAKGVVQLKDLDSGAQREVSMDGLAEALKA